MTLEQCVEKFLRTVQENPGLPVYCWVDCEVVCGDEYGRWLGEIGDCRVADVTMDEVMLPYMVDDMGRTVYELYQSRQLLIGEGASG